MDDGSLPPFLRLTGTPPQSIEEVLPVVRGYRDSCNDTLLGLQWNPASVVVRHGSYDAFGQPTKPVYEGRWEVIRFSAEPPVVIHRVEDPVTGAYRAIGWWLVDFLQQWDRANAHWIVEQRRLADEAEREVAAEHARAAERDEAFLDAASERLGGQQYIGRGFAIEGDRAVTGTPRLIEGAGARLKPPRVHLTLSPQD